MPKVSFLLDAFTDNTRVIIESVDSISRDGTDTPYM